MTIYLKKHHHFFQAGVLMSIYCNREILTVFKDTDLPKSKSELIFIAKTKQDISEASIISLNQLEDKIFGTLEEICENIKITCTLGIYDALKDLAYPATGKEIMQHAKMKNSLINVIKELEELPEDITFKSIDDICK